MRSTRSGSLTWASGMEMRRVCICAALVKPGIDVAQRLEGADHEAGTDQQHEGERHLHDHQDAARAMAFAALAERRGRRRAGDCEMCGRAYLKTGMRPKTSPAASEMARVKASTTGSMAMLSRRGRLAELGGGEGAQGGVGEARAEGSAGEGEDQAFEQKFAGDAAPAGAEGGADGEFLAAAVGAHEEEVGDVGAGNQQDHADGAHEDPEGGADVAEQVVFEEAEVGADACFLEHFDAEAAGGGGNFWLAMGSMRATSAVAWARVTPGLRRATPW